MHGQLECPFLKGCQKCDLTSLPVSLLATAGRDNRGHTESYGWCIESFDTAVCSPLPLAILFQGCAHRVLGEH